MKKTAILTMILSLVVVSSCLTAYAEDVSSQVSALEQKADRVQAQIKQAQQQANLGVDSQVKALNASIDSLVKQRVQVDGHIARLEGQIADLKQSTDSTLSRQVEQYQTELHAIKQQISSLVSKKSAKPAQTAVDAAPKPAAAAASETAAKDKAWSEPATAPAAK
jgi:predicted  nucleic acid-binding Zn-ribbon protein